MKNVVVMVLVIIMLFGVVFVEGIKEFCIGILGGENV